MRRFWDLTGPCGHLGVSLATAELALQSPSEVLRGQERLQPWDMALLSLLKWQRYAVVAVNSGPFTTHVTLGLLPLAPSTSRTFFSVYSGTSKGPIFVKKCNTVQRLGRASDTHPTDSWAKTQKPKSKPFSHLTTKPLLLPYERGSLKPLQYLLLHL